MTCQLYLPPYVEAGIKEALPHLKTDPIAMLKIIRAIGRARNRMVTDEIQQFWDEMTKAMIVDGSSTERDAFWLIGIALTTIKESRNGEVR